MCWRVEQDFSSSPHTPERARSYVGAQLDAVLSWPRRHEVTEDARLAVSELVTNAIQAHSSSVAVALELHHGALRLEVHDDAPGMPVLREQQADAASGRGLVILERISRAWGVETASGRKTVWARFDVPSGLTDELTCTATRG